MQVDEIRQRPQLSGGRKGQNMINDNNYYLYKGYYIDYNFYGHGEYTVSYCGDDVEFRTEEDTKAFIDEVAELG